MRSALLLSLASILAAVTAIPAGDEKDAQPSKNSYVKVRVEVEIRGILRVTDKGTTVMARDQMFNLFNDAEEITASSRATVYTLDFARAKDLRELANVLSGKEVVVTGMSELRQVTQKAPPGGSTGFGPPQLSPPTWSLQRTVTVTGLKSVGEK
jgi:hypothetical protein